MLIKAKLSFAGPVSMYAGEIKNCESSPEILSLVDDGYIEVLDGEFPIKNPDNTEENPDDTEENPDNAEETPEDEDVSEDDGEVETKPNNNKPNSRKAKA